MHQAERARGDDDEYMFEHLLDLDLGAPPPAPAAPVVPPPVPAAPVVRPPVPAGPVLSRQGVAEREL